MLQIKNIYKSYDALTIQGIRSSCELVSFNNKIERNLESRFQEDLVLCDVNLTIRKGETVAILGENGSGKTTLLKVLAGLLPTDAGTLYLDRKEYTQQAHALVPGHEKIKLVNQHFALSPNLSIKDNFLHALKAYQSEYRLTHTQELLELLGLTSLQAKLPRMISGGEQQRAAIGLALCSHPEVLLMDEPFSNLDVFHRYHLTKYLRPLAKRLKIMVVFATHSMEDAFLLAPRTVIIRKGKIIDDKDTYALYHQPSDYYTARLTGMINTLSISKHHTMYFRPEQAVLYKNEYMDDGVLLYGAVSGIISSVIPRGNSYLYEVKVKRDFIWVPSEAEFTPGDACYVVIHQRLDLSPNQ